MKSTIPTLARWGAVALMVGALAGCGGSDNGTAAAPPGGGAAPPPAAGVTAPTGTAPVTFSATTGPTLTSPAVTIGGVTISNPPVVTFAISDGAATDNPVLGVKAATTGLRFMLAKLVPGTNGAPSKWVSYNVLNSDGVSARRPSYEVNGTVVDNGDGTYSYTFANDITTLKDKIAAMTFTAPQSAADLGDLTYDPTLTHRLVIQFSGNSMPNPVNAVYDFIPSTGKAVAATDTQREVVSIDSCNQCHEKLTLHGSRNEAKYCVTCHTDQRKFGRDNVTSTALAFPTLTETATVDPTTGITSYRYIPSTYVADGEVSGNFTTLIHKIHQGKDLVKENYHYAGVVFNNKAFSMLGGGQKMCVVCHDNTKAAQADNWNTVPTRLACGACHDGINFATGAGTTLGGLTTGHVGKAQSSDATCALCHASADIKVYHYTENKTEHNPTTPAGLVNFTYEIKSAAVDATTNALSIVFKISADGTALTTLSPAGFDRSPSFILAWAEAQDGIAAPADFNNPTNAKGDTTTLSFSNTTITGPDASGYFTATSLPGKAFPPGAKMRTVGLQGYYVQAAGTGGIAADTARHTVSAVKTVTGDTKRRAVFDSAKCANCHEFFEGHGGNRVFSKDTPATETSVCVMCHVPAKATSGRGITDTVWDDYTAAGLFSANDLRILAEWGVSTTATNRALALPVTSNNMKDMIHGIHAGRDRVTPFKDARDRTSYSRTTGKIGGAITLLDFRRMDFPGKINNCETCHISGTYASVPTNALASTYESVNTAGNTTPTLAKAALDQANNTDTVTSPFSAACVACHDSVAAQSHMATQGGLIMGTRAAFQTKVATPGSGEACATCHGVGRAEDVTVKHAQ